MAFPAESPFTLNGLPKFLSIVYHRFVFIGVYTFAELGIADILVNANPNHGLTAEEIIVDKRAIWNSALLHRILRTCSEIGIVKQIDNGVDDKHFVLTQSGIMLTSEHPSHARDLIRWVLGPLHGNASVQLPALVRGESTGSGLSRISNGLKLYELLAKHENQDLFRIFAGNLAASAYCSNRKLVEDVDYGRFSSVIDHGGHRGGFLAQILDHYPAVKHGIVFDLPHVIDEFNNGEEFKSQNISQDRYTFVPGNMFDSSTIPQAEAYVLKYILHNYKDENAVSILSSIRKANQNRSDVQPTIFIIEHVIFPEGAVSNWQAYGIDMATAYMHENASERTVHEYQQLLDKAGFKFKKLYPLQTPQSVIEAVMIK